MGNHVDLEGPIQMQEDQLEKFINFLKYLLDQKIEIQKVKEKERFGMHSEKKQKKWTFDELFMLLDPNLDNLDLTKKLDRSSMSVSMERSGFVTSFICGFLSIGILLRLLKTKQFKLFGVYCVVLGLVVFLF